MALLSLKNCVKRQVAQLSSHFWKAACLGQAVYEQLKAYTFLGFYVSCRRFPAFRQATSGQKGAPMLLLLIPGAGGVEAQFSWIVRRLLVAHPDLKVEAYKPVRGMACDQESLLLATQLLHYQQQYAHIVLLGHSRGGLLANEALKYLTGNEALTLVTLATPWHGAMAAEKMCSLKRFRPGKSFVRSVEWVVGTHLDHLTQSYWPYSNKPGKIYPIVAKYDVIVGGIHRQSPIAQVTAIVPSTHLGIPFHPKTLEAILGIMKNLKAEKLTFD